MKLNEKTSIIFSLFLKLKLDDALLFRIVDDLGMKLPPIM